MDETIKKLLEKGYLIDPDLTDLISRYFKDISLIKILSQINAPKLISKQFFSANIQKIIQILPYFNTNEKEVQKITQGLISDLNLLTTDLDKLKQEQKKQEETTSFSTKQSFDTDKQNLNTKINKRNFIKKRNIWVQELEFNYKKIDVKDFSNYFKNRLLFMRPFIQEHHLENLTAINKIPSTRTKNTISVIGLVSSMRITKNKNLLIELEDMTGKIPLVINRNKEELLEKSQKIVLDEAIGIKATGSREILFANDVIFPDIALSERKNAPKEHYAAFTADLHIGSTMFLEKTFIKFIKWLNGETGSETQKELSKKIKYLFIVGDAVDGVGVYPGHEKNLLILDIYEQYSKLAGFLKTLRKDITIILCPGGLHDAVRSLEPQPEIPLEIAPELYEIENLVMVTNPARVLIEKTKDFEGFEILMYHGDSYPYYTDFVDFLKKINAKLSPDKILHFLLEKRHLAPTHGSTSVIPFENDYLSIKNVPDVLVSGHIHKSRVSRYKGILTIACSCWQSKTVYQEKFGHEPEPGKVPILNLKTGKVTMLDFS